MFTRARGGVARVTLAPVSTLLDRRKTDRTVSLACDGPNWDGKETKNEIWFRQRNDLESDDEPVTRESVRFGAEARLLAASLFIGGPAKTRTMTAKREVPSLNLDGVTGEPGEGG